MLLETAVHGAARKPERVGGAAHVAIETFERALDEVALRIVERHAFEQRRTTTRYPQAEILWLTRFALRHQHGALDDVLELAHITRPRMVAHRVERLGLETGDRFFITLRLP